MNRKGVKKGKRRKRDTGELADKRATGKNIRKSRGRRDWIERWKGGAQENEASVLWLGDGKKESSRGSFSSKAER